MVDEFLNIDTPENVVFGYEVVGVGSRFIAALIDTLIIVILQIVAILGFAFLVLTVFDVEMASVWITAVYLLVSFALLWGYYIFFELRWNGQSPGKRWAGLRVIRRDGTPITLTESIIRNLVRIIDFMPGFYGVGLIAMFVDQQARRLGDMAAGTLVVRDQEQVTLESLRATSHSGLMIPNRAPTGADAEVDDWPLELLKESEIQLAEAFLGRQDELSNRAALAAQILNRLLAKMGMLDKQIPAHDVVYVLARIVRLRRMREKDLGETD